MAQFQVRTGPLLNDAAPFSPEMVQGSMPTQKPRLVLGVRIPPPQSQPTHVQAAFGPEMTQGVTVPSPRFKPAQQQSIADLNFVTPYAFESILGSQLDSRNHLTWPKQYMQIAQTSHVAVGFSPEMAAGAQGVTFPAPRLHLGVRIPQPLAQTTHTPAPFSVEMAAGTQGQTYPSPRILLGQRIPLPISQTTHVGAFSPEMVAGVTVPRPRLYQPRQLSQADLIFILEFAFESVLSLRLDSRNHLTRPQHLPAIAQTTHTDAPFSMEMTQGVTAPLPRILRPRQITRPDPVFVLEFAFESVLAGRLDARNHLTKPQHVPAISQTTPIVAFSPEMVLGNRPPENKRIRPLQLRIGDLVFIPPFHFESVLGGRLDARGGRLYLPKQFVEQQVGPIHEQAPISIEMFAGAQGVFNRLKLGPRIPLPFSQTTHTAAAFSPEMVQGAGSQLETIIRKLLGNPRWRMPEGVSSGFIFTILTILPDLIATSTLIDTLPKTTDISDLPRSTRPSGLPHTTRKKP